MRSPLDSRSGLSIRARTVLGYSLIVFLALFASIFTLLHMHSAEESIQTIMMGSDRLQALSVLRMEWDALIADLNNMLLTRQSSIAGREIEQSISDLTATMDSLRKQYEGDALYESLRPLEQYIGSAVLAVDSIRNAAEDGLWASAQIIHHTHLASIQRRLESELENLQDYTSQEVLMDSEESARIQNLMRKGELGIAILVLILGPLAAVLTASSIVRPIEYLASSVRSLTFEGLEKKLEVSRSDEIGELAEAYNSMTERLHTALTGLEKQIEAYRDVQNALIFSENRYRNLFQHSPIGLCELDLSSVDKGLFASCHGKIDDILDSESRILSGIQIVDMNDAALKLLAADSMDEMSDLESFMTYEMNRTLFEAICSFSRGSSNYSSEVEITDLKGNRKYAIAHLAVPPESEDVFAKIFVSLQDITARRRVERALRQSEEQYYHAQKMEAVGRLTGGIAHDFNNLLTVILNNCDIALMDEGISKKLSRYLDQIRSAASRAASVTEQLLAFSHQHVSHPVATDINGLLRDVVKMLSHVIGEDIDLVTEFQNDLPSVTVDPGHIEQVILNLAVNARDAMPSGGRLTLSTAGKLFTEEEIEDKTHAGAGEYIRIKVEDTGSGMDNETLERAFEPFFTTKERGKGTGLGLASVHSLVTEIGGWIDVESQPGVGTGFIINIPASKVTAETPLKKSGNEVMEQGEGTVLLVEDEAGVRDVVSNALRLSGYRVMDAEDGDSAIHEFRKHNMEFDLLVSDVVLPGELNGIQIARRLREMKPGLRILLMSGYVQDPITGSEGLPDNTGFLAKPFSMSVFLRKVRESLKQ